MNRSWKLVSLVIICITVTAMVLIDGCQAPSNVIANDNQNAIVLDNSVYNPSTQSISENTSGALYSQRLDNNVLISLPFAPLVGQEVGLECTVYSDTGCDNATAWLLLPDEATVLTGTTIYSGKIGRVQQVSITKPIVFHKPGHYQILALANFQCYPNDSLHWGIGQIFLTVGSKDSKLGPEPGANYETGVPAPKHGIPPQPVSPDSLFQIVLWAVVAIAVIALAIILIVRFQRKQH